MIFPECLSIQANWILACQVLFDPSFMSFNFQNICISCHSSSVNALLWPRLTLFLATRAADEVLDQGLWVVCSKEGVWDPGFIQVILQHWERMFRCLVEIRTWGIFLRERKYWPLTWVINGILRGSWLKPETVAEKKKRNGFACLKQLVNPRVQWGYMPALHKGYHWQLWYQKHSSNTNKVEKKTYPLEKDSTAVR